MNDDFKEKLKGIEYLNINQQMIADLQEFYPTLEKNFDAIISSLFDYLKNFPEMTQKFEDEKKNDQFKQLFKSHWQRLYQGNLDEHYFNNVNQLGAVYQQVQLEPQWVINSYCFVMIKLLEASALHIKKPEKLSRIQKCLMSISFFNMNLALSFYLKKGEENKLKSLVSNISSSLEQAIQTAVISIVELAQDMTINSQDMEKSLSLVFEKMHDTSELNGRNRSNVQSVVASSEQLLNSVQEISQQTSRSSNITSQSVITSHQASQVIHQLEGAAKKIGEIVRLISDIASQTNLLALNATIEAARAGEAGKGFAVVAAEVKSLATQTAKATQEIATQVTSIQSVTLNAVSAVNMIGSTINEVNQISNIISGAVEEQNSATLFITRIIQQASQDSDNFSSSIEQVMREMILNTRSATNLKMKSTQITSKITALKEELSEILIHSSL